MSATREQLKALQDSITRSTGGASPEQAGNPNRLIPPGSPNDLQVAPSKPDPEAAANQILDDHINEMKMQQMPQNNSDQNQGQMAKQAALQQMTQSRQANGINPQTGMPFQSPQAPVSPEDAARKQQMQFKMQYLQNRSNGQQ